MAGAVSVLLSQHRNAVCPGITFKKTFSVSSGTAFFLLWNEKDKVSKLPANQNQHKNDRKSDLKSEDLFVF